MPIYEFRGRETGRVHEWIGPFSERPSKLYDPDTGEEFILKLSAPNLCKSNLSSWQEGLSHQTYYDRNLKQTIYGEAHKERVLKARGLVRESDLPKNWVADRMASQLEQQEKADKESDHFFEKMKEYNLDKPEKDGCANTRVKATEEFWSDITPAKPTIEKINKEKENG
tara:strand:- start:3801 stop:4307 length:507 start_codon:yes stop_codon:yes gene_type:complete